MFEKKEEFMERRARIHFRAFVDERTERVIFCIARPLLYLDSARVRTPGNVRVRYFKVGEGAAFFSVSFIHSRS